MNLQNDLLLRAALGEQVERVPVWLMRQAGRILPEYRAVRARLKDFRELVKTPEAAAEVTIQPVDLLGVDAAIIFSDILVIPEAMGLPYEMIEARGPFFPKTIQNAKDIDELRIADGATDLAYVIDAIKLTKRDLNGRVPLIGFAGAPWTIFCYMIEGKGSKTFSEPKKWLYTQPELSHKLLDKITTSTISYLKAQIAAGADILQIFDSWAGVLSPDLFHTFSLPYLKRISEAITEVPLTLFAKDAHYAVKAFAETQCSVIGLDWTQDPKEARKLAPNKTLQGNMDPCLLYGDFATIKRETEKMLRNFGEQRYIANLGHGVYPDVNPDHVRCFVDTIKSYQAAIV